MQLSAALVAVSLFLASVVRAQAPSDERGTALQLGEEGMTLYRDGRYEESYERFNRADELVHSPVFVLQMARAKRRLGQLMRARQLYRRLVDERLPPEAPEPWLVAKRDAEVEHQEVEALMPRIRIEVQGSVAAGEVQVRLDGRLLDEGARGAEHPVDPGEHLVEAWRGRERPTAKQVSLAAGSGTTTVQLQLPPRAVEVQPSPQPWARPIESRNKSAQRGAIAMFVLGGVSLVLGIASGAAAIAIDKQLDEACGSDPCHPQYESDVEAFHGLGYTASATLPIGAALVGGGLIVWFVTQEMP